MTSPSRLVLACAALAFAAVPAFAQEYTPTSYTGGYTAPPAGATTVIGANKDDETVTVALPFETSFFGRLSLNVSVCSNGWLAFGTTTVRTAGNAALPTAAQPNGIVAAVWDDFATGANGKVVTFVEGTAPSRTFVVSWQAMEVLETQATDTVSFQVRLHEDTGVVEIAYDGANGNWNGLSFTSGIEDPTGTRAFGAGTLGNTQSGAPTLDWRFDPRVVTVTGRLLRDRPVAGTGGLGGTTETGLPVAGADLLLLREDNGDPAARGVTAADGTFAVTLLGTDAPTTLEARVLASSPEVRVVDATGAIHGHTFATGVGVGTSPDLGTTTLDANVDASNGAIRRALNIHQAIRRGIVRAAQAAEFAGPGTDPPEDAETFPRIDAQWTPGAASSDGRTQYVLATFTPATSTTPEVRTPPIIRVHEGADNPDPWDDDVLLRATAQHVLATISRLDTPIAGHTWETVSAADKAFVDGFSHWFACALQDRNIFIDTKSATESIVRDLETIPDTVPKKPDVTADVAASLWDLTDPANEPRDDFAGTLGPSPSTLDEILRTLDRSLDAPAATPDVGDFFDAWAASRTPTEAQQTARVFIRYGTLPDDAKEANDLAGEETIVPGPAGKLDLLTISPHNEDRFSIAFGGAGTEPLEVTVGLTADSETDVEVLDAGGALVASATNAGTPTQHRIVARTAGAAAAGTYTVRVLWHGGAASGYSLAFHEPVRFTPSDLGEWTEGVLFTQVRDFQAAGGIAPYTFTLSDLPEGLSASTNGRRLVGTPEQAGTYDVTVQVSDASGPGVSLTQSVPLVVNPPLRLARWFGTPSGSPLSADVGTGGTQAEWTPLTPPPAMFDVTGGATLVASSRGVALTTADTFEVDVSAVDAAGDEVPRTAAHVVVCDVVPAKGSAPVPANGTFGLWFDAFEGAKPDLRFKFQGRGATPRLVAVVDAEGREADLGGGASVSGAVVRLRGVRLPRTGRWFAVFEKNAGSPFSGKVSAAGRSDVVREVHGGVVIDDPAEFVEVTFEASAGSRGRIVVRAEEVPNRVHPAVGRLEDPDGAEQPKGRREVRRKGEVVEHPSVQLATTGTWRLFLGSDASGSTRTGPMHWSVKTTPPDRRSFVLFDEE